LPHRSEHEYIQTSESCINSIFTPITSQSAHALKLSDRPSNLAAPPPVGQDRDRWALVSLAAANSVPETGEQHTSDEDDGSVVHVVRCNGEGGGHGEERDGEADPGCEEMLVMR
jgi:hypothetical protein